MNELAELVARVAELERRHAQQDRYGTVKQRRIRNGQVEIRMAIGQNDDGGDLLSPWIPWASQAGATQAHVPPSEGQQVRLRAPGGDYRQAVAEPFTWSNTTPVPSQSLDENVIARGQVRIEMRDGELVIKAPKLRIEAGGVSHEITAAGVKTTGGKVEHDGRSIGSDHRHGGVEPGAGQTAEPA